MTAFRGSITRLTHPLSTLSPPGRPYADPRLAPGRRPTFTGRDWLPVRVAMKGFKVASVLLSQALLGATASADSKTTNPASIFPDAGHSSLLLPSGSVVFCVALTPSAVVPANFSDRPSTGPKKRPYGTRVHRCTPVPSKKPADRQRGPGSAFGPLIRSASKHP